MAISEENRFEIDEIICSLFDISRVDLNDSSLFSEDLGIDSIDYIELIMSIEKEFDINLPDVETEGLDNYGQFLTVVGKYI